MKIKNILVVIVSAVALIALWLFIDEREKGKRKDALIDKLREENEELKIGYLTLLESFLRQQAEVSNDVLEELHNLKNSIDDLDTDVHIELNSVIKLVEEGEGTKAVRDLAKIVEAKLKEKVSKEPNFKGKPMLHNLLEFACKCQWLNPRQYENAKFLKDIRNKESHELAVKETQLNIGMALFVGIDILYTVSKIK